MSLARIEPHHLLESDSISPISPLPLLALTEDSQFLRVDNDLVIKILSDSLVIRDYFLNPVTLKIADGEALSVHDILSLVSQQATPVMFAAAENIPGILAGETVGTVTRVVNGPIEIQNAQGSMRTVDQGDAIYLHDTVITPARSYIKIVLEDNSEVQVGPLSRVSLDKYTYNADQPEDGGQFESGILTGIFRFVSGEISGSEEKQHTTIKTPSSNIGIRGSEIDIQVNGNGDTTILFSSGLIDITTTSETLSIYEPGTEITIPNDGSHLQVHEASPTEILETRHLLEPLNPLGAYESVKEDSLFKSQMVEPESVIEETVHSPDLGALNPFSALLPQEDTLLISSDIEHPLRPETLVIQEDSTVLPPQTVFFVETPVSTIEEIQPYPKNPIIFNEDNAIILNNVLSSENINGALEILPAQQGTVTSNQDGSFTYTPTDTAFRGEDSFGYRFSPEADFTIVSVPDIHPLTIIVRSATESVGSLRADNTVLSPVEITQPTHGQITDNGDGTLIYFPEPNFYGEDSFIYRLAGENPIQVDLVVESVNDAPQFNNITPQLTLTEDTDLTIPTAVLLENVTDIEGDPVTLFAVNTDGQTVVTFDALDNTLTFSPAPDFNGQTTFRYTVADDQGALASNQATLTVVAVDDPPVSVPVENTPPPPLLPPPVVSTNNVPVARNDGVFDLDANNEIILSTDQLLANDYDSDGDTLSVVGVSHSLGGIVTLQNNGEITFTALADFNGEGQFTYQISDGHGEFASATVFLSGHTIITNQNPIAIDDTFVIDKLEPIEIPIAKLLNNDSDPEQSALKIVTVEAKNGGSVHLAENVVTFTPNAEFINQGQFVYTISDEHGGTNTATVTLTLEAPIKPINQNPNAVDDNVTIHQSVEPTVILNSDLLQNDTDNDNDLLTIVKVTEAEQGSVELTADNQIIFSPTTDFVQGRFSYTVSDGQGGEDTATVTIENTNRNPIANEDTFLFSTALTTTDLLANDSDPNGDPLIVSQVGEAVSGQVALDVTTGQITFTPFPTFDVLDSAQFSYTVEDGRGGTATAIVTLTQDNDPPQAQDDSVNVSPTQPTTIPSAILLANDSDPNQDSLTIQTIGTVTQGTVTLDDVTGDILFIPNATFAEIGTANFTYTISDGHHDNTATAQVSLTRTNENPVAIGDSITVSNTGTVTILSPLLLLNDSDQDGDSLKISDVSNAINGQVTLDNGGDIIFTPDDLFNQTGGQFTYTVEDGYGGIATTTVTLNAVNTNSPPIAEADFFATKANTPLTILTTELLKNDQDIDGDALSIIAFGEAGNGQVELTEQNAVIYTPDADFSGTDHFSYTVEDGQGGSAEAVVTVSVAKIENSPPMVTDDVLEKPFNVAVVIPTSELLANDGDIDLQDNLTVNAVNSTSGNVEVALVNNEIRLFVDALTSDDYDTASFDYTVSDGQGGNAQGTVTVQGSNVFYTTPGEIATGTAGLDILIGSGRGDEFAPSEGADLLLGLAGNDTFLLNPNAEGVLIDGGEGKDTLNLVGEGQTLDLIKNSTLAEGQQLNLQGIDVIALNGTDQLRLSVQDVLDISDEGRLFVEGNSQSFVNSVGQGWNDQGTIGIDGATYYRYLNGDAELLVSTAIEARFIS